MSNKNAKEDPYNITNKNIYLATATCPFTIASIPSFLTSCHRLMFHKSRYFQFGSQLIIETFGNALFCAIYSTFRHLTSFAEIDSQSRNLQLRFHYQALSAQINKKLDKFKMCWIFFHNITLLILIN